MYFDFALLVRNNADQLAQLLGLTYNVVQFKDGAGNAAEYYVFEMDLPDVAAFGRYMQANIFTQAVYQLCGIGYVGNIDLASLYRYLWANFRLDKNLVGQSRWRWNKNNDVEVVVTYKVAGELAIDVIPAPFYRDSRDAQEAAQLLNVFGWIGQYFR